MSEAYLYAFPVVSYIFYISMTLLLVYIAKLSSEKYLGTRDRESDPFGLIRVNRSTRMVIESNDLVRGIVGDPLGKPLESVVRFDGDTASIGNKVYTWKKVDSARGEDIVLLDDVTDLRTKIGQLQTAAFAMRHDLANHITIVRTAVQYMDIEGFSEEAYDLLTSEVENAHELVQGLAAWMSLIEGKTDHIDMSSIDLNEVVDGIDSQGMDVQRGDLGHVYGNEGLIANIIRNLFNNAFKYSDSREPSVLMSRDVSTLYIKDDAGGFGCIDGTYNHESALNLVRPRQRGHDDIPGSGLGLAIVKATAELHDWVLDWSVDCGSGSTTWILRLPAESPK